MEKLLSHRFCYIIYITILLGTHSCNCTTTPQKPTSQETLPPQKGYWHTGSPEKILEIKAYPPNTHNKELYKRPYQIYLVKHDGSCGFRSFIPILFHEILGTGKLEQWLAYIENTIYKPAQRIIAEVNDWTSIKAEIGTIYPDNTASNNLYKEFENLLNQLNTEPATRPLQEKEIKLSIDFLRQCLFMHLVISGYPKEKNNKTAAASELKEKLKQEASRRKGLVNCWAFDDDFKIFNISYGLMCDEDLITEEKVHNMCYYFLDNKDWTIFIDNYKIIKELPNGQEMVIEKSKLGAIMYHHDNVYYEYMIPQRGEQF